jgi:hypothetical protein
MAATGGKDNAAGGKGNAMGGKGNATAGTTSGGAGETGGTESTGGTPTAGSAAGGMANAGSANNEAGMAGEPTGGVGGTGGAGGTAGSTNNGGTGLGGSLSMGGEPNSAGADTGGADGGGADSGGANTGGTTSTGGTGGTSSGGIGGAGGAPSGDLCATADEGYALSLTCPGTGVVSAIVFASYGTPTGTCGDFVASTCDATTSVAALEDACLGNNSCAVSASNDVFTDPCVGTYKRLYVEATCSNCGNGDLDEGEACDDGLNDGVFCNSDCSAQTDLAQILVNCGPGEAVLNTLQGTECVVVAGGGASYITFLSPDVQATLFSNADCTGSTKTVSTDLNFCQHGFDQGGGLNDQVRSVIVSRK